MAVPLITKEQLIARIGQVQFGRVFDDNNDGQADKLSEEQVRKDASTKVRGALGPVYAQAALVADEDSDLPRITLDVAEAMATRRRPTILKGNWKEMMDQADKDLKAIRLTMANLGTDGSPEPAANNGGEVLSGDPNDPCPKEHFALNGTGDF